MTSFRTHRSTRVSPASYAHNLSFGTPGNDREKYWEQLYEGVPLQAPAANKWGRPHSQNLTNSLKRTMVIDWFRLLLGCLGRAGRHRRTGRESLRSQPDSYSNRVSPADFNVSIQISVGLHHADRFPSDGAYPRPSGRGIAPVQRIKLTRLLDGHRAATRPTCNQQSDQAVRSRP